MELPDTDDALIRSLYEAAAGVKPWQEPLAALYTAFGVRGIQLVIVDKTTGKLLLSEQPTRQFDQLAVDATLEHIREWHRADPHMAYVAKLPVGAVMHSADVIDPEQRATDPFYREYWSAYNVRSILAAKVAEDDRHLALLGMTRTYAEPAFDRSDIRLLERYVGHLEAAMRISQHFRRLHASASVGTAIMQASTRAMLLLDLDGSIVTANPVAGELLGRGNMLLQRNGKLTACAASGQRILQDALARAGEGAATANKQRRIGFRISSPTSGDALCSLWMLEPGATMGAFGARPLAMLTVTLTASGSTAVDPVFLAALFDLTPAEARVAAGLMCGHDLHAIALERRLSPETVRSQLRSIFLKTGTRRQAHLVEVLLRAVAI